MEANLNNWFVSESPFNTNVKCECKLEEITPISFCEKISRTLYKSLLHDQTLGLNIMKNPK
jgi:hypothetical protein